MVPIVAHVVYDLLTFLEVHQRATAQLENTMTGNLPQKQQVLCGMVHNRAAVTPATTSITLRVDTSWYVSYEVLIIMVL